MTSNQLSLDALEGWRTKASAHSSHDRIGIVIARYFDLMSTMARDGVGAESVSDQIALLDHDRSFVSSRDSSANTPLRELIYGMIESFGLLVDDINKKRADEIAQLMGQSATRAADPFEADSNQSVHSHLELGTVLKEETVSTVGIPPFMIPSSTRSDGGGGGETGVSSTSTHERTPQPGGQMTSTMMPSTSSTRTTTSTLREEEPTSSRAAHNHQPSTSKRPRVDDREVADRREETPAAAAVQRYGCDKCSERFDTYSKLMEHQSAHGHLSKPPPAMLPTTPDLIRQGSSEPGRKFQCTECPASFKHAYSLRDHTMAHNGERPHVCSECPSRFVSNSQLKHHQRNSHNMLPYTCPCGWKFEKKAELVKHRDTCLMG
ncbi:hypothetical protein PMAYCL1PPCAC_04398 [Pristionchus mayeri]|uniref:C2H2-type domain-containing protein n=1 Tax=Pristionchus mayeri TaxID=1317129 RepID=A0AAN5C279_9BILA|nr:hypothetical protein PMAYCL1PPCAC_04398 [Pristionchus mayeri]